MSEWADSIKIMVEVAIGAITALSTVWITLRQSRGDVRKSVSDSFQTMVKDMTDERNELVELIRQSHQENLELQKELIRLRALKPSRKPSVKE